MSVMQENNTGAPRLFTKAEGKAGTLTSEAISIITSLHAIPSGATAEVKHSRGCHLEAVSAEKAFIMMDLSTYHLAHLLHESGHWLDMLLGGSRVYRAEVTFSDIVQGRPYGQMMPHMHSESAEAGDHITFLKQTEAYVKLAKVASEARDYSARRWAAYAITPPELFAETYAQWALLQSGHDELLSTCSKALAECGVPAGHALWSADDLETVGKYVQSIVAKRTAHKAA